MALFKTITQGGQVHLHQLHMLKQILVAGLVVALIAGGGYFIWQSFTLPKHDWRMAYETTWARFMVATNPPENHKTLTQIYTPPRGKPYQRHCLSILKDPVLKKAMKRVEKFVEETARFFLVLPQVGYPPLEVFSPPLL